MGATLPTPGCVARILAVCWARSEELGNRGGASGTYNAHRSCARRSGPAVWRGTMIRRAWRHRPSFAATGGKGLWRNDAGGAVAWWRRPGHPHHEQCGAWLAQTTLAGAGALTRNRRAKHGRSGTCGSGHLDPLEKLGNNRTMADGLAWHRNKAARPVRGGTGPGPLLKYCCGRRELGQMPNKRVGDPGGAASGTPPLAQF